MYLKIFVYCISLFSFLTIGPSYIQQENDYYKVESHFKKTSQFIENGVKLQYTANNNIRDEIERVNKILKDKHDKTLVEGNKIQVILEQGKYEVMFWEEQKKIFVEATFINQNPSYSTMEIKKELENLQKEHLKNVRYFEYYKGKIKSMEDGVDELKACLSIKEHNMVNIKNGVTCRAISNNENKINITFNEYNTGIYVVIGTPTIFTTY